MQKEEVQMLGFEIISLVGTAKSCFIESMDLSKRKEYSKAQELIEEGIILKNNAHKVHFDLIQMEAEGKEIVFSLILMHAEDQLLTSEVYQTMAEELLQLRKELIEN